MGTTEEGADMATEEEEIRDKMIDQATQTELETQQTYTPEDQKVQTNELLSTSGKTISAQTTGAAGEIKAEDFSQEAPKAKGPAKGYQAEKTAPKVGDAEAAEGSLSQGSIMQAAQGTVSPASLAKAATATMDPRATTQFQLEQLLSGIEDGKPLPSWASPAVRSVAGVMASRGLGASSMAAAAMTQAVMESGIKVASEDASRYQTLQLANLSNEQQATLQNAATYAAMDMANLNNRQMAAVNNAKAFLAIDLQNLTNEQQSKTITYQSKVSALLSDAAAANAAKQFNARSQNEVDLFFAELGANIESASLNRVAGLKQFNINNKIAVDQFNAQMKTTKDQFNANMRLQVDQSNAVWRRNVNTANTAAQNEANRLNVMNLLGIQQNAMNNIWQAYRDQASWNMKTSENAKDRAHNAAMQSAQIAGDKDLYDDQYDDWLTIELIDNFFTGGSSNQTA